MTKSAVTTSELKSLIVARFDARRRRGSELRKSLRKQIGNHLFPENPGAVISKMKIMDCVSGIVAERLKKGETTAPLFSPEDFCRCAPPTFDKAAETSGHERVHGVVHAPVLPGKNPHEEYWRWVGVVLNLVAKHGISPTEMLASDDASDEITRRTFTEEEFTLLSWRVTQRFTDAGVLGKMITQPAIQMIPEGIEEGDRHALEWEISLVFASRSHEIAENNKAIINSWITGEVDRIYATA